MIALGIVYDGICNKICIIVSKVDKIQSTTVKIIMASHFQIIKPFFYSISRRVARMASSTQK